MLKAKNIVSKQAKRLSIKSYSGKTPSPLSQEPGMPPPNTTVDGTDLSVPEQLQKGVEMVKISDKKQKRAVFRIDPDEGQILYKSRNSGTVPIESIKEIRTGQNTSYYRLQFGVPKSWEERWLTIIYIVDGSYKTLHMIADTVEVFKLWDEALTKLHAIRQGLTVGLGNVDLRQTIWERQYWKGADKEGDHKLDFENVERLCKRLNVSFGTGELQKIFQDADVQKRGYLDFQEYQAFIKVLKYRPELEAIYNKLLADNGGKFDFEAFKKFLVNAQQVPFIEDEFRTLYFKHTSTSDTNLMSTIMTLDQFSSYLLSPDNTVFSEYGLPVWQDMTRSLADYYISSSHNTYLVGHQLVGVSTIEGYIRALLHSCRSVELDIYDGETEPMIYHGKTFTSKVSLRDICQAINKYAFTTSPYPLLISAEVHCSIKQQDKIVDIMIETFGDKLIRKPESVIGEVERKKLEALPSPEELKYKILLKAKNHYVVAQLAEKQATKQAEQERLVGLFDDLTSSESSSDEEERQSGSKGFKGGLKNKWRKLRGKSTPTTPTTPTGSPETSATSSSSKPKPKMSFRLAALLVYTVGVKCHGIGSHATVTYAPEHIFSLSENAINRLTKSTSGSPGGTKTGGGMVKEIIEHTQKNLVRIYPKGTRIGSTNFEPHKYWGVGAQVVAINWQTFDLGYTINQAMFQRNGRSGYVLKPLALRTEGKELLNVRTKHYLDVTIISAQQLPRLRDSSGQEIIEKSIVDPFIEVTLHVPDWTTSPFLPTSSLTTQSPKYEAATNPTTTTTNPITTATSTTRKTSLKTKVVKNNGFNPVWNEFLSIPFDCVGGEEGGMKELIFVEVAVRQQGKEGENDERIAIYCAPLSSFRLGYRHLPLHDMQLTQHMFSTLFVKIGIRNVQ